MADRARLTRLTSWNYERPKSDPPVEPGVPVLPVPYDEPVLPYDEPVVPGVPDA